MGAGGCERNEFRFLGGGIGMCWGRSTICSMAGRDRRAFLTERVARCVPCSSPSVRGVFNLGFGSSATGPSASKVETCPREIQVWLSSRGRFLGSTPGKTLSRVHTACLFSEQKSFPLRSSLKPTTSQAGSPMPCRCHTKSAAHTGRTSSTIPARCVSVVVLATHHVSNRCCARAP